MAGAIIRVDSDALEALADECVGVAERMDDLGDGVFDASVEVIGDAGLAAALEDFHDRWSDRRGALGEELRAAASSLDAAAAGFRDTDQQQAGQLE